MSDVVIELLESITADKHTWAAGCRGRLVHVIDEDSWHVELPRSDGRSSRVVVQVDQVRVPIRSAAS
jgi:hypothetical protein